MFKLLDIFFLIFHTSLILFNLFGWIIKSLRRANLVVLLLTGGSWLILGLFYGFGFCPLTEFHWEVLRRLGETQLPDSYVSYLVHRFTGFMPGERITEILTLVFYLMAIAASIYVNFRTMRKSR